jgi:hypothetical protein
LKYVSGLVFRSDAAAGRRPGTAGAAAIPAALILANLIAADPGWATARIRPVLILHSKNSGN